MRGTRGWPTTGLIPWFSKTEGNTYATLLHHPFLFGENQRSAKRGSKKDFWRRCRGGLRKSQHTKYPSHTLISRITLFAICLSFSSPANSPLPFYSPSFSVRLFFACFLFACVLDCLLVTVAQDNTKLCDFTNTNNNDFITTPIAPDVDAESCEINTALLNLVMKDQFVGLPSEDAATHLNSFVDLCDMQKKKDVDNDVVKLKLFLFRLEIVLKLGFRLCLKIVLIHATSAKMLLSLSIFLPLRSSLLGTTL